MQGLADQTQDYTIVYGAFHRKAGRAGGGPAADSAACAILVRFPFVPGPQLSQQARPRPVRPALGPGGVGDARGPRCRSERQIVALANDRFLRACRRQPVDVTPVWFMRQAGRYMREYRALRERHSMLTLCRTPDLATEVTLQPIRRFPLDAAIIFSDLLLPLDPLGIPFDFVRGEGPQIERPLRSEADIRGLRAFEPREALAPVMTAIRQVKAELDGLPLIGFAGAPFTLASYAVEGGHSSQYAHTKALMYGNPEAWHLLCERLAESAGRFLVAQVEAGADAVQLFDSWVGVLGPADYREFVLPHTRRVFDIVRPTGVPTIHFGTGTATLLEAMAEAGGDVIGADWRIPLDAAWAKVGEERGIQGNLDPTLLLGPRERMLKGAEDVLCRAAGRPGHIFNLGHGLLPSTPVEQVEALAEFVHGWARG